MPLFPLGATGFLRVRIQKNPRDTRTDGFRSRARDSSKPDPAAAVASFRQGRDLDGLNLGCESK